MKREQLIRFLSGFMLIVMLIMMIDGLHDSIHAMQVHSFPADNQSTHSARSIHQTSAYDPIGHHKDLDGCDICVTCECHAPLSEQAFYLNNNASMSEHDLIDVFMNLPEIFLTRFIPPEKQA
jgi:hypothetical protein